MGHRLAAPGQRAAPRRPHHSAPETWTSSQIVEQGGDYALALKENHPALCEEVRLTFAYARADDFAVYAAADHDFARTVDKAHRRLAIRRHWTLHDPDLLALCWPRSPSARPPRRCSVARGAVRP